MENIVFVVILALAAPLGFAIGYAFRRQIAISNANSVEARAEQIIQSAKAQEKDFLLKAKDKALATIEQAKKEESELHRELQEQQRRLEKREGVFEQKILDLEEKQERLVEKAKKVEAIKEQVIALRDEQMAKLQSIAALTRDQAKEELFNIVEKQEEENLMHRIHKLESQSSEELERRARTMLSGVMQRWTGSHVSETTTTMVELPSDEMKGRIIGKEGRNIKTIEQMTGVEIIVDDTPQTIMVSGFNPVRRHLAKRALDKLIEDGRIHPARIEEAVEQSKKELAQDIKKAGEDACYEVGVAGLDPKLIQILGRLKYRTSYGQNVLKHSIEVAQVGGMLAAELGANVSVCKKGGLLHDIGKALDHEVQGGHPEIGYDLMKKFGLPEEVAYLAIAHHEDAPHTLEGVIARVADQISGGRPGARRDSYEQYVQRLEELEAVAKRYEGVERVYAIQAGRELRIFVQSDIVSDLQVQKLAKAIAQDIEQELNYPGEIKVTMIRETRVIEYAR